MKKLWKTGVAILAATLLLAGCGNSKQAAEATTEAKADEITIEYSKGLTEDGKVDGINAQDVVTLCDYKKIEIKKADVAPADGEVDEQINNLLQNYGEYEGEVKDGDKVNINYSGSIDGEKFNGGTASDQMLVIGSKTFIDNFEEQIIGHTPGDTFDVNVTFPKDYHAEELAGKEAVFSVTLNYIVPELSDEFVAKNFSETNGVSTIKELKNAIKENIIASNKNTYVWNYMMENCKVEEIPEDILNARLDVSLDLLRKQYHDYMGYDDEQILGMYGFESIDQLRDQLKGDTEDSIKAILIATAISEKEKIEVDDATIDKTLGQAYADSYYEMYGKGYVHSEVLRMLVSDYLGKNAVMK